jgi:hypothetical protein
MKALLVVIGFVAAATAASAGDGRIEINQACAVETGCGSEASGFPVSTQANTSYVLTSNLTLPDASTTGIRLEPGTTLDMNGFSIVGPTACTGSPAVCTGTGSGDGITLMNGYASVRNGRITGAGRFGIYSHAEGGRFENVIAAGNGEDGFNLSGAGFQVVGCVAEFNGNDGFFSAYQGSGASLYHGNTSRGNGDDGFDVSGALLLDNVASDNLDYGLNAAYSETDTAWGRNAFRDNNEGNGNPQAAGGNQLGTNACASGSC